jgi:uncharacterized membrane protein
MRNPNEVIEDEMTFGDRLSDAVARFGGSWAFISLFSIVLVIYMAINVWLGKSAWDRIRSSQGGSQQDSTT